MIKKYKDYIILLIVFLLIIFGSNINAFLRSFDNNLNSNNINNNYCTSLENDYNELLKINDFKITSELNLVVSKVMLRDIYEFRDTLTIYKGTNSGIKEGNAVITDKGLIGVVSKVNKESSVVELITNKSSNISVRIGSSYGILNMQDNSLIVSDLSMYDDVFIGEEVYTSGIGNLPGDIYIGNVIDIKANNTEIEKILEVSPVVDLSMVNYVMVVV